MTSEDQREADLAGFLDELAPPISDLCERLRGAVKTAVPDAVERLRPGWRLIGYDLPVSGKRKAIYFAWIWPEAGHVHVGWQTGTLMNDPRHLLRGAQLKLKKVRYLTYAPGDRASARLVQAFTRDAARIARMSRGEREILALSRLDHADNR